jgi:hypothetical protein
MLQYAEGSYAGLEVGFLLHIAVLTEIMLDS